MSKIPCCAVTWLPSSELVLLTQVINRTIDTLSVTHFVWPRHATYCCVFV
jgi:hypothetical protein